MVSSLLGELAIMNQKAGWAPQVTLLGTKTDDPNLRVVTYDAASSFAEGRGLEYYETSVMTDDSSDVFAQIVTGVCKTLEKLEESEEPMKLNLDPGLFCMLVVIILAYTIKFTIIIHFSLQQFTSMKSTFGWHNL